MDYLNGTLPGAQMSPRIINGVLKWYEGDTFQLSVEINLQDEVGNTIDILESHTVEFKFYNEKERMVHWVTFGNIQDNTVLLIVDDVVTKKFPKGKYTYDVIYNGVMRKTLSHKAPIVVE